MVSVRAWLVECQMTAHRPLVSWYRQLRRRPWAVGGNWGGRRGLATRLWLRWNDKIPMAPTSILVVSGARAAMQSCSSRSIGEVCRRRRCAPTSLVRCSAVGTGATRSQLVLRMKRRRADGIGSASGRFNLTVWGLVALPLRPLPPWLPRRDQDHPENIGAVARLPVLWLQVADAGPGSWGLVAAP